MQIMNQVDLVRVDANRSISHTFFLKYFDSQVKIKLITYLYNYAKKKDLVKFYNKINSKNEEYEIY